LDEHYTGEVRMRGEIREGAVQFAIQMRNRL